MAVDRQKAEQAIHAFLTALGHDPAENPELARTPALVTEAYERELLAGYAIDVPALLTAESGKLSPDEPRGLVVLRNVHVATLCPHHLLPGTGIATVAYVPGDRVVGIGALARTVEAFARRLTLQETIGEAVVRALVEHAGARGAYCRVELSHACLSTRGARQTEATLVTVARAGAPITDAELGPGGLR
ncbi:MAG TPA: GTP cyclohydrolase I [Polyangiaceae bacterium]|jgi:GTP cyclohydrolase I|nr:GTP cyclohydrolase I [Polyangiaceae bacterium]